MSEFSRRDLLRRAPGALAVPALAGTGPHPANANATPCAAAIVSLDGEWQFRTEAEREWTVVTVPHTWQTTERWASYAGPAFYRKEFNAPGDWAGKTVRVEFEAVYHSAIVVVNGREVGRHTGKGYTAFTLDVTPALKPGAVNVIEVRADNSFNDDMLPRGNSFDWTNDGGIYRPVRLLVTGPEFIEGVDVDAIPAADLSAAPVHANVRVKNSGPRAVRLALASRLLEESSGRVAAEELVMGPVVQPNSSASIAMAARIARPRLWHFDDPQLYRLETVLLRDNVPVHGVSSVFGVRRFEVRDSAFYLNGERVRLMGVERMAGSNPAYGMAEPEQWLVHDHNDLKEVNCVFTRVHWQQDRRMLDYCDRHGIMVQLEVPSWGPETFKETGAEPKPELLRNGLEQLREMVERDRNHACVVAWGLCNEVNGQNAAAQAFIRKLNTEAKKLDPHRLTTYASNSLQTTPERDAAGELDFISWNEYYESWYRGAIAEVNANLQAIHRAFPGKPVVVSEYGYCECTPDRTGGDEARARILQTHTDAYRAHEYVGGSIFFCYNDYRTIVGDKGTGVMKQRVHGVVDVNGTRKPSFGELRRMSSPVSELIVRRDGERLVCLVTARNSIPAYTLRGYTLRWVGYGFGDLPMEQHEDTLPALEPGARAELSRTFAQKDIRRVRVDVVRPTGFSAADAEWRA